MQAKSWAEKYRPQSCADLVGNEEAVSKFGSWLGSWTSRRGKTKKACLLVGPPGVGKTSLARAAANDFRFRVVELNASDVRTEKAIEKALVPASALTLDSYSEASHGNLILLDEVDGVFGREDRGGIGAILSAVEVSPVPIILTANNVEDERFDDLRKACSVIELFEIRPRLLLMLVQRIIAEERVNISPRVIEAIVRRSRGDLRSTINDAQAAAAGVFDVSASRTQKLNEGLTLKGLFESHEFGKARRALNDTEIPLYKDELLLLLHDLLPYVYTSRLKLALAYDSLSRADIAYGRIGASRSRGMEPPPFNMPRRDSVPQWNLLPVALNELASVGVQETDNSVENALSSSTRPSQKTAERYQYRLWTINRVCGKLARSCHISKRTALRHVFPFLIGLFRADETSGIETATAMELEERDIEFLKGEAKSAVTLTGSAEMLDPADFKLPYMGKDKFIQLMRVGIKYNSSARVFSVRRMDNLDSVEESLSQIVGKPVKFVRPELISELKHVSENITMVCYVDGKEISCDTCNFVESCPTRFLQDLKYCICKETLSDEQAYREYITKNQEFLEEMIPAKKVAVKKPKAGKRKKTSVRD
ncbi:MAG: replication factor C large subunit [Candidatus Bathyarchaeia archaeon]